MEKDNINFDPENGQQFNNAFNGQAPDFKALFDNKIHWKLAILFTLFLFAYTYFQLPVYNFIYDTSIVFMMIVVTIYAALLIKNKKFVTILIPFFIFVYLGLSIYSSPIVNSGKYYDLLGGVETIDYNTSPPKIDNSKLPVVDEGLARKLGDKVLGKEIGLGSQFTIGEYYFITTDKDIAWVAPLEPRSFFKWLQNQDGAPGYIYVSATNPNDVRLVKEVDGKPIKIKYTNNAYFMSNIHRYTYFNGNMTNGLTDYSFEINDSGKPYWVITTYKPQVGFAGYDTTGVVIVDAQTGEVKKYSTEDELPKWVERVHPTRFLQQQIN